MIPKKSLGQHFLKNSAIIQKTFAALDFKKSGAIFEIGPGHGELTLSLAHACAEANTAAAKSNCRIVAIEKDATLATRLKLQIEQLNLEKIVEVAEGDALKILRDRAAALADDYEIVGNIPYYITGHLLRMIGELEHRPARTVLMVQKEVAERIVAAAPRMNRLAASVQFWSEAKIVGAVGKENFTPAPKVDSAIILLELKKDIAPENVARYYAAVRMLFAQPRKTVLNNLVGKEEPKEKIAAALQKIGVDPGLRPQNLTVEQVATIAQELF